MASRTDKDEVIESAEEFDTNPSKRKRQNTGHSAKSYQGEGQRQESLMTKVERLINHFDGHVEEKKEIESLKKQLKESDNERKEAVAELYTHKIEILNLKSENLKLKIELASFKEDARTELNKMTVKEEAIQKLQNDMKIEKARTASFQERLIEMLSSATAEKNDLKLTKTELEEKVKETEQRIKLLQSENYTLQQQITEKPTHNEELRREKLENEPLAELDPSKKEIQRLKNHFQNNHSLTKLNEVDVQSNLSEDSTFLRIENRMINYVAPGTFDNLSSLTVLDFDGSGLIFLEDGVFNNLTNLITLSLNDNYLTCLDGNVFAGLKKLQNISLNGNDITKLPSQLFRGLDSLDYISLSYNKISVFDEDLLVGLNRLIQFGANNNNLTSIPEKLFEDCVKLEQIWLNDNIIVRLKTTIVDSLHNLRWLELHNNPLNGMDKNALRMLQIYELKI